MMRILLRLTLYGFLITCFAGCSAMDQFSKKETDKSTVSEEDITDEGRQESDSHLSHPALPVEELPPPSPDHTAGPAAGEIPAQPVDQSSTVADPVDRPPRRLIWRDRKGWAPGKADPVEENP